MEKRNRPASRNAGAKGLRQKAEKLGHRGETLAAWALRLKGYRIVEQRYRTKAGEIDIIARRGDLVAMVEVKARKSVDDAVHAVSFHSQKRIVDAANFWLSRQADFARISIRFDIVAIVPGRWPRHIKDAW